MPKMDGVEFLGRAQKISPATVRMMLTGFADFDAIINAINQGQIYRYITKPWEPTDLEIDVRQAIDRYAIQASLDQRMNELQALCDISAAITSTLNSEEVINKILDGVVHALGFDRAYLMRLDPANNVLKGAGSCGVEGEARDFLNQLTYDLDRSDVGVVLTLKENRPILVEDIENAPINLDNEALQRVGVRSFVTAPLQAGDHPIGVLVADRNSPGERVSEHDLRLLVGFANQAAIALENARLYEEALEKQRLEEEINVAANIQTRLLPETLPELDHYELAALSQPSRGIGGDYYDIIDMGDGRMWIALGDVCGKGIPAALTMATLRTLFRSQLDHAQPLADMMQHVSEGLFNATAPEVFATFFFGVLDLNTQTFTYVNAAHPFPVLARESGETIELKGAGIPAGLDPIMAIEPYAEHSITLTNGDVLVIYSDGVSEAGARTGDMFDEPRIHELTKAHRESGANAVQNAICTAVETFMNGQAMDDDLTLVALSVK